MDDHGIRLDTKGPVQELALDCGWITGNPETDPLPGFDYVLGAKSTVINRAIGMCPPISKLITSPYASGRTHRVESRTHSLSEVRTERTKAALHTAEIAVASHRAAEIE